MFSAVVYTTGRTGSNLITRNLATYFKVPHYNDNDISTDVDHGVVHCHNPLWFPSNNNFVCILSKRRNLFDAIMSILLGKTSNEFSTYTNKLIVPTTVSQLDFTNCYWFMKSFYASIDTSSFKQVLDIYYEDLIDNPSYLFSLLNIDSKTSYNLSEKSPYRYKDLILNVDLLRILFADLEKLTLTDDLIASFKNSIKMDLENSNKIISESFALRT